MPVFALAYRSFGDILETIKLGPKIIEVIRSGGSPSDEWAATEKALNSFVQDLTHLARLQSPSPLDKAITERDPIAPWGELT
ncbi:hypothetical protein C8J57DRAFT_1723830 [Mycena rebaudengoi]|nr:hypothetical protein C8J57DRAFT_1723830 [Mycena rebaudengoi]